MMRASFQATLRLTLRSIWLWAVLLLPLLVLWLFSRGPRGVSGILSLYHDMLLFPIFFLGQMLAVTADAQREQNQGASELLESLPYRTGPVLLGRLSALYLLWLAAGTLIYATGVVTEVVLPGEKLESILLWDWFLLLPVTLLLTTSLAFVIGWRMRRGFTPYVVSLLAFVLPTFPFNQASSQMMQELFGAGPISIFDFTLGTYFHISVGPFYPDWWPLLFNRVFTVAAGVALVAGLLRAAARRRGDAVRGAGAAVVSAVLVAALMLTGNRSALAYRVAQSHMEEASYESGLPAATAKVPAPAVDRYDVNLWTRPEFPLLAAEARLELTAPGETATFTLNRIFVDLKVAGPDGRPVAVTRSGDLIIVETGGKAGTYAFSYQGFVGQWRKDSFGGLRLGAHVDNGSIMLPASLGWYPIPGAQTLAYRRMGGVEDAGIKHAPIPFRLTLTVGDALHLITNANDGRPVTAAWLIVTPWSSRPMEAPVPIEAAVSAGNQRSATRLVSSYGQVIAFYHRLVPLDGPIRLVEVPDSLWVSRHHFQPIGYPGALVLPSEALGYLDNMVIQTYLLELWWNQARTSEEQQVHATLSRFMADLYNRDQKGPSQALLLGRPGMGPASSMEEQVLKALNGLYEQRGLEALAPVLQTLHASAEPLTFKRVWEEAQR